MILKENWNESDLLSSFWELSGLIWLCIVCIDNTRRFVSTNLFHKILMI